MNLADQSDADILEAVTPLMDNLMDASSATDHARHIRDFTDRLKCQLSADRFRRICADYQSTRGFFAEREPVAIFRRPDSVAVIWKQRFTKQPGEFVAELVVVQQDGRYLVDHVMVF